MTGATSIFPHRLRRFLTALAVRRPTLAGGARARRFRSSTPRAGNPVAAAGHGRVAIPRIPRVAAVLLAAMLAGPATASDRVALVIGNADYRHDARLANPVNDARDR